MRPPFLLFGTPHLVVLALTVAAPLLLAGLLRLCRLPVDRVARLSFAAFLTLGWICWFILFAERGWLTVGSALPLNLCDWALIALVIALLTRNQFAYELGYFWGLGGTLQGMITPDVAYDFPDPQFLFFFVEHGGIIAALLYLTLGTGLRPRPSSLPRVAATTLFYALVAGIADWGSGTNYGFLRAKPPGATLLSLMSPWPWYIPELVAAGILSLMVYYLPFAVLDWSRRKR
ncbi:MAG TPA: TIGR02206 family membrane protein [Rhizomicrobium sp.]|nr:TIGR02206 family membrane protein [Rhizomicrobium sp.]